MLERPLLYLTPTIAGTLFCAVYLDIEISLSIALLLLALFLFLCGIFIYRKQFVTIFGILTTAAFAFSVFSIYNTIHVEPVRALKGQHMEIEAVLLQDSRIYETSQRALLSVMGNEQVDRPFRAYCYLPLTNVPLIAGDRIKVNVEFYLPNTADGFDRAMHQAANGCFISAAYVEDNQGKPLYFDYIDSDCNQLRFLPQRIARYCKQAITDNLPERSAGLLTALLLGDKSGISDDDMLSIRIAGLSHLIAVSGLHIGFLVSFCFILGRRIGTYVSIPLILVFVPIAGATPSVIRAAIMYLIAAAGFILRKETSSLNALFFALTLLLFMNPYSIASLSLQLSFLATLGLITLSGKMQHQLMRYFASFSKITKHLMRIMIASLSCTICAIIFTAPVVLHSFGYISILSILSNLLVVGVTSVCFILGFLLCCTAIPLPWICAGYAKILDPLLNYILSICKWTANLPFGRIHWTDAFGVASMAACFVGIVLWLLLDKHIKSRYILSGVLLLLVTISSYGAYYNDQRYTVTYLPSGGGQAILVSDTEHHLTLIDCAGDGSYRNAADAVSEWMQWNGFNHIDTLVLTGVDKSHARDLPELLQNIRVDQIYMPKGCKANKHNYAFLQILQKFKAEEVVASFPLSSAAAPITLFPICDGKLGVQIDDQALILHSPSQKQLAAYFRSAVHTAPTLVISQRNTADAAFLDNLLSATQAKRIILQTGTGDVLREFHNIPIESTYFEGTIQEKYKKEA